MRQQPSVHDLVVCVQAPTVALSGVDGQIRAGGAQGLLYGDLRVLSRAELTIDGAEPVPESAEPAAGPVAAFTCVPRTPGLRIGRRRRVRGNGLSEHIRIESAGPARVDVRLGVSLDF